MSRVRVKICCIANIDEAKLAVDAGADALGLVSAMPSGPGPIDEAVIAEIAEAAPPGVATFLLTSLTDVDAIIAQHVRCRTTAIQLVDTLPPGSLERLRGALPGVKLVQVIHVQGEHNVAEAVAAEQADAILLDSGNPGLAVKQLGGTGRAHDWAISRRVVTSVRQPVYLAGGLNAGNVGSAIERVRPFGVDLCGGVRTNGRLDADKLAAFMRAVDATREAVPC
jgi:phosphoribosylanthranilate isomerase